MPLKPDEVIARADDLRELGELIVDALKKDEDGRVRLSRREASRIGKLMLAVLPGLILDILD